jgi:hypothetical protein
VHGFRHRHEVARRTSIGDADRATLLNLVPEKPRDASCASGDVSESHVREASTSRARELLNAQLRDLFRQTHVVARGDGFVG